MKKINTTNVSSTKRQPFLGRSVRHLKEGTMETVNSLARSVIPTYNTGDVIILWGCLVTVGSPTAAGACTITAGAVYYNGEVYECAGFSAVITGSNVVVGTLTTTYQSGDPVTMSDSSTANVHEIVTMNLTQALTGTADKDFSLFGTLVKVNTTTTCASFANTSTSYVDVTGLSIVTPNDGYSRKYLAIFNSDNDQNSSTTNAFHVIRIYNSTDSVVIKEITVGKGASAISGYFRMNGDICIPCTIGANKTVKVQAKYTTADGTIYDATFSLVELSRS